MKALERIFLYSVLAILVFYVFLVDGNVESQVAIQEEIRARSIAIVNGEEQAVVKLFAVKDGNGVITIYNYNKDGRRLAAEIESTEDGGAIYIRNEDGTPAVGVRASEYGDGKILVWNRTGQTFTAGIGATEDGDGVIFVCNRHGDIIGGLP